MRPVAAILGAIIILSLAQQVAGYTFTGQDPVSDSVRLEFNADESMDDVLALDVMAYQVSGVESAAFDIDIDTSVVKWEGMHLNDPDGFVKGDFFGSSAWVAVGNLKDMEGNVDSSKIIVGVIGEGENSGSGRIITIKFRIVGDGSSDITFSRNNLILPDMSFTSTTWLGGSLEVGTVPQYQPPEDDPPVINLDYPPDDEIFSVDDVEFMCSASDDIGLDNITLYTDAWGSWSPFLTIDDPDMNQQSFLLEDIPSGTHEWNCLAYDSSQQASWGTENLQFIVSLPADTSPPLISNLQVSGELVTGNNVTISLSTSEEASCRYSPNPGMAFHIMNDSFTESGSLSHSVNISLKTYNNEYTYYVRCQDEHGNSNEEDEMISFSVGSPVSDDDPPEILGLSPASDVEHWKKTNLITINTDEYAECRISETAGTDFGSMTLFSQTYTNNHSHTVTDLKEGENATYYIKCRDEVGNENTETEISFFVCYEVDSDCSETVELEEMLSFIERWYINSRDVSMKRLMQAVGIWADSFP